MTHLPRSAPRLRFVLGSVDGWLEGLVLTHERIFAKGADTPVIFADLETGDSSPLALEGPKPQKWSAPTIAKDGRLAFLAWHDDESLGVVLHEIDLSGGGQRILPTGLDWSRIEGLDVWRGPCTMCP